ncbi:HlyD family type I secretion periplasmic adaptor subunit [Candidatus Symbiopectobacterium sp. NZEC127]|uniref:HlyD family type I secretion periplasmic adaptor subunit n=1 Tax=Candidatus Symbiopectobacterium sp. NZEC127 TaxID=2820472 RepID=UPI0022279806|nr:HlyD family type I secretion periplasmic adaptor subunit [Candidatus Symbiopectobacterium sp. NZEC127]MCW2486669.1 HlyD family type I secretion periplasmic adaptor subunit [Candidatus Symbiopectobacterium sp. NZEC127]
MKAHYREFLPAVIEIQETPPSPVGRAILWVIMVSLILAVLWSALGKVDIVAVTHGKVAVRELSRPVSTAVTAEVASVLVRDGMAVKQGQALIKLNSQHLDERAEELRLRQKLNRFHLVRLDKLNRYYNGQTWSTVFPDRYRREDTQLADQLAALLITEVENDRYEKEVYESKKAVLHAKMMGHHSRQRLAEEQLMVFKEQYQAIESLYQKKITSRDSLLEIKKEYLEAHHAVDGVAANQEESRRSLTQLEQEQSSAEAKKINSVAQNIAEREHENHLLASQLKQINAQIAQYTLRSPVEGIVDSLAFRDAGGAVEPPQELLKVVPVDSELVAEVMIKNQDVGFLRVGQSVTVKINTFDFTRYGWVDGTLQNISADATEDKALGLVYRAVIALKHRSLRVGSDEWQLEPGMQVTAEIKTGKRTFLSYLISPAMEALHDVGKQR